MTHQVVPDRSQGGTDGRLLGPYRLSRRLASGGLSAVFLATDTRDDSQVAVKVFKPEVNHNPELVWLSERSLAVTRQLDHPNLIKILDGGVHDERRYSVMEYVAGGRTLAQELAEGPLSLSRGLSVLRQVLEAIDAIHCAGMAHRDIKPDNILLVPHNDGPQVKILDLDFLGPIGHRRLARVREILGTPKYMAPEEIHRGYPHPRGDLFSLGVTAYELFSGQEPFKVDKEVGYLYANRFQSHEPLTRLRPDLPESVGRFVGHLLARQPGERYDSGTALHDCLILENACGSPAGVFSSAPVGLVGPPRIRHWSTQLASLWTAAALLPLAFGLLWLASGERPMAVPFADATEPLRVSKQAPPSRPAPVAPWPQWQVRTASTPQNRAWQKARLSEENGSPESRKTAITLLNDIAADSGHPHYEEACALLARLQEIEFLRLRRSQPVRALACLTAARNATRDNQLRHRLSSEIAKFEKHLASQELASKAPEGFVLCPGKPAVFISRRLVSNLEYLAYLKDRNAPAPPNWPSGNLPLGLEHQAMRGATSESAPGYAGWRGARLPRRSELLAVQSQLVGQQSEWVIDVNGKISLLGEEPTTAGVRLALPSGRQLKELVPPRPEHEIQIDSTPSGAQVSLGGKRLGITPLALKAYYGGMLSLKLTRNGYLPAIEHLELNNPVQKLQKSLYPANVLPRALRNYETDRESAYKLLALALAKPTLLAKNLLYLVLDAHPQDWRVLSLVRDSPTVSNQPRLCAQLDSEIRLLDQKIDLLRTSRYEGKLIAIEQALLKLGYDPHHKMVSIPAGAYKSGTEKPRQGENSYSTRETKAYWVDQYEVTNREYARFLAATGHRGPSHFDGINPPAKLLDHPVTNVSLTDSRLYAKWVGKRLPTEYEWEKAARGSLYREYPWGKDFWHRAANSQVSRIGSTTVVGQFQAGKSPYGVHDMGGNVWELTETRWSSRYIVKLYTVKGGSYLSGRSDCRIAARKSLAPTATAVDIGFRCVSD